MSDFIRLNSDCNLLGLLNEYNDKNFLTRMQKYNQFKNNKKNE